MAPNHSFDGDKLTSPYSCLVSGEYSDLTITCGSMTWKVHRVIICPRSPVLKSACTRGFKEATTMIINLKDDNPFAVNLMVDFLYTGDYVADIDADEPHRATRSNPDHPSTIGKLRTHAQLYCLADKYDIKALLEVARLKYQGCLQSGNVFNEFLSSIPEVYLPQASKTLRTVAITYARKYSTASYFKNREGSELKNAIKDTPEFGFDLLEAFITAPLRGKCRNCGPDQPAESLQARCGRCKLGGTTDTY
ncbi:hypothetical protein VE03_09604 [Pseudogymnoascus sp. 23342-1-I1]|nr:hypothetical protein VE03_09604 [Pseudogymnoascus sp. 23342-1-I1]